MSIRRTVFRGAAVAGCLAACLAVGVAAAQKAADKAADKAAKAQEPPKPTVLKPGKMHEVCMVLSSAQRLEYTFSTTKPVDFNIHYHKGESVYYPVKRPKTTGESDRFTPASGRSDYCLMWENKSSGDIEVTHSYKVVNQ
jgi:hypothetical protein